MGQTKSRDWTTIAACEECGEEYDHRGHCACDPVDARPSKTGDQMRQAYKEERFREIIREELSSLDKCVCFQLF